MVMSERTSDAKRDGARIFGVIFHFLAALSLAGTLIATLKVAQLGSTIGIGGAKDPLAWIVFVSGLFATCVLAGFGFALGALCAIYDRQEPAETFVATTPCTACQGPGLESPSLRLKVLNAEIVSLTP